MAWENVGETGDERCSASSVHFPVMAAEVLQWLRPRSGGIYVDCTVGYCGHALAILSSCQPDGILFGIDRDLQAIDSCRKRLHAFGDRAWLVKAHFMELKTTLMQRGIQRVDGVLFDLGVSSPPPTVDASLCRSTHETGTPSIAAISLVERPRS